MHSNKAIAELSGRIHTALRDGDLEAEPILELACLLEEHGVTTSATQELLARPLAHLTAADLTRLSRSLLNEAGFEPTFTLEPRLWTTLVQALEIVERDVRAKGITGTFRLATPDWDDSGYAWVEFQGIYQGNGIGPDEAHHAQGALARVADAAQEVIMESIWQVWPLCPTHHHGLHATLKNRTAVWQCTGSGTHTVAPVGDLP